MGDENFIHRRRIEADLIDYNGHLTEWAYYRIFSDALTDLLSLMGVGKEHRQRTRGTIYSLESHGIFLREAREGDEVAVRFQVLDHDEKRVHLLLDLLRGDEILAAYENVSLYVVQSENGPPKAGRMPEPTLAWLRDAMNRTENLERPAYAGRGLSIRRGRS